MQFKTSPKIVIDVAYSATTGGAPWTLMRDLIEYLSDEPAEKSWREGGEGGRIVLDVNVAERAVAWLKAHGVEQESTAPERDTARAIGRCRRCGEKDARRSNGRCQGVPGSTHDWPEMPAVTP